MVCFATPRLGYQPTLCLARPMLYAALDCLDKGDFIGAGVRLREAVQRFVRAMAEWHGVDVPSKEKHPRPAAYIKALVKAGRLDDFGRECLFEMLGAGNNLAHCRKVDPNLLRGGIAMLFAFMDGEPFCPHDRKPLCTSHTTDPYDDDDCDDDSADWWKSEGGAA